MPSDGGSDGGVGGRGGYGGSSGGSSGGDSNYGGYGGLGIGNPGSYGGTNDAGVTGGRGDGGVYSGSDIADAISEVNRSDAVAQETEKSTGLTGLAKAFFGSPQDITVAPSTAIIDKAFNSYTNLSKDLSGLGIGNPGAYDGESVPDFDKSFDAVVNGLTDNVKSHQINTALGFLGSVVSGPSPLGLLKSSYNTVKGLKSIENQAKTNFGEYLGQVTFDQALANRTEGGNPSGGEEGGDSNSPANVMKTLAETATGGDNVADNTTDLMAQLQAELGGSTGDSNISFKVGNQEVSIMPKAKRDELALLLDYLRIQQGDEQYQQTADWQREQANPSFIDKGSQLIGLGSDAIGLWQGISSLF